MTKTNNLSNIAAENMYPHGKYITFVVMICVSCIDKSLEEGFSITKFDNKEIFLPTKTVLKVSNERR